MRFVQALAFVRGAATSGDRAALFLTPVLPLAQVQYAAATTASIIQGPSFIVQGVVIPITQFGDEITGAIAAAGSEFMATVSNAGAMAADTIDWLIDPDYGKKKSKPPAA